MTEGRLIPVGRNPAGCSREEFGGEFSDPPAAVRVFRITSRRQSIASLVASQPPEAVQVFRITVRRCGIASRVALRLLIAGSGGRPTGCASGKFGHLRPVGSTSPGGSPGPAFHPFLILATIVLQPNEEGRTSRWMRRRAAR